jgi:hypothetical protein
MTTLNRTLSVLELVPSRGCCGCDDYPGWLLVLRVCLKL